MQRTHIYLPDDLNTEIEFTAKTQGKSKAEVIREALTEGLKAVQPSRSGSAQSLMDIAKEAQKLNISGPRDLSINHDYYTWGGKKKKITKNDK